MVLKFEELISIAAIARTKEYYFSLLLHHLHRQIRRPDWLIDTVSSGTNVVPQLHCVVAKLSNRLHDHESAVNCLGNPGFEELRLEKSLRVILLKQR